MLVLLLANWRIIAYIGAVIAVFMAGEHYGASRIQNKWDKASLAQQEAIIADHQRVESDAAAKAAEYEKVAAQARLDLAATQRRLKDVLGKNGALKACNADDDFVGVYDSIIAPTIH